MTELPAARTSAGVFLARSANDGFTLRR